MNQCASKCPTIPHGAKVRKLWQGKFYLSPDDRGVLHQRIETEEYTREDEAVDFIDERGEWLE